MPKLRLFISILLFAICSNANERFSASQTCSNTCKFHLCQRTGKLNPLPHGFNNILRAPGEPMDGVFCTKYVILKNVTIREPLVRAHDSKRFVSISTFRRGAFFPHFRPRYFAVVKQFGGGVTITHQSRGNQYDYIDNLCVTLSLRSYTRRTPPYVLKPSRPIFTNDPDDCVSFRAVSPKLIFEIIWNSHDDFDLSVTEPTNPPAKVSRFNTTSQNGGQLLFDVGSEGVVRCGKPKFSNTKNRESIVYMTDSTAPSGTYKVEIQHHRNCYRGPTEFNLKVMVHGTVVMTETGVSNGDLASIAGAYMIDIKM